MHTHVHFPADSTDREAYSDAKPPTAATAHKMTTYSDACWGGQYGEAVRDGTPLPLFKYRSLSGYVVFRCGGPVSWGAVRQERTALSSCEAEWHAGARGISEALGVTSLLEWLGYSVRLSWACDSSSARALARLLSAPAAALACISAIDTSGVPVRWPLVEVEVTSC